MRAAFKKTTALFCALGALILCGGALGVVGGTADTGHPYVVAAFAPHELCSGALLSRTVVVTAAHCYAGVPEGGSVQITLGPVVHPGTDFLPTTATYAGAIHRATDGRDLAVVVLEEPGVDLNGTYAQLPALGAADLPSSQRTDVVGFGISEIKSGVPVAFGTKRIVTANVAGAGALGADFLKVISGPCQGDSGAPNLLPDSNIVLAITISSNGNPNCNGNSFSLRLDTPAAQEFVGRYLG